MSSRHPTDVGTSLRALFRRGGEIAPHADGWGVAYYAEGDVRLIRTEKAASSCPWATMVEESDYDSDIVLAHIRKATDGERTLRNTQPFARELGGRMHVFAHNGHVPSLREDPRLRLGDARPIGTTDSEPVFCVPVDRVRAAWKRHDWQPPPRSERYDILAELAEQLRPHGPSNLLYTDGDALFVHSDQRTQEDGEIRPPGMHLLERECPDERDGGQRVVVVASVPLSDERWRPLERGTVLALTSGSVAPPARAA